MDDRSRCEHLYNQGLWTDEIASEMGIKEEQVKQWLSARGLTYKPIPKSKEWREQFDIAWTKACNRLRGEHV